MNLNKKLKQFLGEVSIDYNIENKLIKLAKNLYNQMADDMFGEQESGDTVRATMLDVLARAIPRDLVGDWNKLSIQQKKDLIRKAFPNRTYHI